MKNRILPLSCAFAALALAPVHAASETSAPENAALPRPLTLDAALTFAAEHNPALHRVREQFAEQEGVLVEVRARQLPAVEVSGSYRRVDESLLKGPGGTLLTDDQSWQADVVVSQAIYAGGAIRSSIKASAEQLEAARLSVAAAVNDTLLTVRERFYGVLLSREIIRVREEALVVLEGELARARQRQQIGAGSDFDLLRAEVAAANARPPLIRARNDYRTAQDLLRIALGAPSGSDAEETDLDVQGHLALPAWQPALADMIVGANEKRPELRAQERIVDAAQYAVDAARAGNRPQVGVFAGYGIQKKSYVSSLHDTVNGWSAGVQTSWSIFDGRETAGRVQQARSRVQQARLGAEELRLEIDVEVRRAHSSLVEATELLSASEKVVEQARESLRISQARLEAGSATQLDVLAAQSALTEASFNLARAEHDHAVAIARLRRAIGDS
jgi:outer membrane protein